MKSRAARLILGAAVIVVLAGAAVFFLRARQAGAPRGEPIVLLGFDAFDWKVLDEVRAAGRAPNFDRLIAEGVHGDLQTLIPLVESPIIWTTIGTGVFPPRHGISGFLREGEGMSPTTSQVRKVKAVWNILGSAGFDVGVVGWLVTWPCEAVNGFMVSDYLQYNFDDVARFQGQTYPASLTEELLPLVVKKQEVPLDSLTWLVDLRPGDLRDPGVRQSMETLRWIYAADETFARIGLKLWRERHPRFFTVYLRGPDSVCHAFWGHRPGVGPGVMIGGELRPSPFARTVDAYYEYMDGVLGRFLAEMDPSVSLIVLSDHGFKGATVAEDGTLFLGVGSHREIGIIVARGPHFRRGATITGAGVEDITPTILYLAGLPLARDMDGEPLWGLFTPEFRQAHRPAFIPTYETGEAAARPAVDHSPVDAELLRRLKSLGYIR